MTFGYVLLTLHIVVSAILLLLIGFQDVKSSRNRLAMMVIAVFTIFSIANTLSLNQSFDQFFWIRLVMSMTALGLYLLYLLLQSLRSTTLLTAANIIIGVLAVSMALLSQTPLIFDGYIPGVPPQPSTGWLAWLFFVYFGWLASLAVRELLRGLKGDSRQNGQYQQFRVLLAGLVPIVALAPMTGLVLPLAGGFNLLIGLGPLYTLFFCLCVSYAMARHGLFDIRSAAVKSMAYVMALSTLAGLYYLLVYLVTVFVMGDRDEPSSSISPINIAVALVLAFLFQSVRGFFDRLTNRLFYRHGYDRDEFYARFNKIITSTTDLRVLLRRAAVEIEETLGASYVVFSLEYEQRRVTVGSRTNIRMPRQDSDDLQLRLDGEGGQVIVARELDSRDLAKKIMYTHRIGMVVQLVRKDNASGHILIGDQRARDYNGRDIETLQAIVGELVIAIENAVSVQKIKDLNATLQQRIDAATAELRQTNDRLKRLDAAKDEFLSMASHQLRTPLTSVKGYLSMMIDGDVGKTTAMQRQVLKEAYASSERMVHLIHDFLNVSRLQTGRFMLELRPASMSAVVAGEVASLESAAASRAMKLELKDELGEQQDVIFDETKLRQVIMNYIDNAIYYSKSDTVIKISLVREKDDLVFTVRDTGIGVPKAEQSRLFEKFFRATNARRQRPDGTGVGLYLARRVMQAHGGGVIFKPHSGGGSTFGFRLPIRLEDSPE